MRTAYILLRFPVPSETFVFREVVNLRRFGLDLQVYTLYGKRASELSAEMEGESDIQRLGLDAAPEIAHALGHWWRRKPGVVRGLFRAAGRQQWRDPEKSGENLLSLLGAFELARRFEKEDVQHIHAPWASGCATAAWAARKLTGIPFSFTARAWDIYPPDGLIRDKIRDAALVRAETLANVQHLTALAPKCADKLYLTYNGVPLRAEEDAPVAMAPPFRLLAMGRFVRKKGFDQLLRAARMLADRGLDFHLTLAGDGMLRRRLKRLARDLGIGGRVSFPGFVRHDSVGALFRGCDIFIMPSVIAPSGDRDGLPTVILEALSHCVPVVATAVSGIPELIEDGTTGLLVPEGDPHAIAEAVLRLVSDRSEAVAMARRGQARVRRDFDPDRNHRALLELYRSVVP